jgi:hypothetical protein
MQWHSLRSCNTLRMSVPGWKVVTYTGYLFIIVRVSLSVLVSCIIFTVWISFAANSSWTSYSGNFGGKPFNTRRGWMASGNGYVW